MDSVALFSWIGWLRHRGILISIKYFVQPLTYVYMEIIVTEKDKEMNELVLKCNTLYDKAHPIQTFNKKRRNKHK